MRFMIKGFENPPTTTRQYFTVTSYHQYLNAYDIDQSKSLFYVDATTGTITITSITPSSTVIYDPDGTYTFVFTPEHAVETTYFIKV